MASAWGLGDTSNPYDKKPHAHRLIRMRTKFAYPILVNHSQPCQLRDTTQGRLSCDAQPDAECTQSRALEGNLKAYRVQLLLRNAQSLNWAATIK